jgi:membrane protein
MAPDYLGQRIGCDRMARRLGSVLMVRGEFRQLQQTYGSLGAIIGFMTWIWISIIVVLVGAKLNAEMEHQTVRDSTTGQAKPLGRRGARMADTVGGSQA